MISLCSSMKERKIKTVCTMTLCHLIVLVLLCHSIEGYALSKHMELDDIQHRCPQLDTCYYRDESRISLSTIQRSCACDKDCSKFDDCCVDAPKLSDDKSNMKCYEVKGVGGLYMIGECPLAYEGDESWKELCEYMEVSDPSDPIGSVPVTDPDTGITYKNVFCKLCNGKFDLMRFWKTKLDCPFLSSFNQTHSITDAYVLKNLVKKDETWGLDIETVDGIFFLECSIETAIPSDIRSELRRCKPSLMSDCPTSWENEVVRQNCKSFLGPRYSEDGYGYRNIHCAICNNVNLADLSCLSPEAESIKLFRFSLTHSFALLLDVNLKKGDKVGMIRLCKSGEVFDPFFKKCRELQCLPGYVRRGRKCLPRRSVSKTFRRPAKYRKTYASTSTPYATTTSRIYSTSGLPSAKVVSYTEKQSTAYSYEAGLYTTSVYPSPASKASIYVYSSPDETFSTRSLYK